MNKYSVYMERQKFYVYSNIDWIKHKTSTYIESLEISMNEVKL